MNAESTEKQVFRFLVGRCSVRRYFEGSYSGAFEGEAKFVASSDAIETYHYTEQGQLTDGEGKTFDAKQSYLYRVAEGKLQVLKRETSDWIVMHVLEFDREDGIATAKHVHLCGQDHYTATYRIDFADTWEIAYTVSGPRKDYRIRSLFERPPSSPGDSSPEPIRQKRPTVRKSAATG